MPVECPSCHCTFSVTPKRAGRTIACSCGTLLSFPTALDSIDINAEIQNPSIPETSEAFNYHPASKGFKSLSYGFLLIAAGIAMTAITYEVGVRGGGGHYTIFYGVIVCGILKCVQAVSQFLTGE